MSRNSIVWGASGGRIRKEGREERKEPASEKGD
jgi:hypothetical protein